MTCMMDCMMDAGEVCILRKVGSCLCAIMHVIGTAIS